MLIVAEKYLNFLKENPLVLTISSDTFTIDEVTSLKQAGFLTLNSQASQSATSFANAASQSTLTSISSASRAASGSAAAVGGEGAIHEAGGSGTASGIRRSSSQHIKDSSQSLLKPDRAYQISLPNTGPYLRLLLAARSHILSLLQKSRFKEMPLYMLQERWDGGIASDDAAAKAKKFRGEFTGVLPARTRKWKQFYGLKFEWVLAECLGAGLIELFETGSVGRAARLV